jgi:ketopantoate reductase
MARNLFIARGAHFESIRANGLTLKMNGGSKVINVVPGSCTSSVQNMPVCDIIILSVKEYDLANAVKRNKKITIEEKQSFSHFSTELIFTNVKESIT